MPGTVIDRRFEIVSQLGEGGMGVVYEALHLEMQRSVAVKVLKALVTEQPEKLARFRTEAQVVSALDHPNIVKVFSIGVDEGKVPYIVMELLRGKTIADLILEKGEIPYRAALPLFVQICDGLSHAHAKGIIHRDLKPSNFVVIEGEEGKQPVVKIVDFGIAKILSEEQGLTQTTGVIGSALYMSPGRCEGRSADNRSDIYSLGCCLFEALSGRPPFAGESVVEIMHKQINEPAPTLRAVRPDLLIPIAIQHVISCCLQKDPQFRFQSVEQLRTDLENALEGRDLQHVPMQDCKPTKRYPLVFFMKNTARALMTFLPLVLIGLVIGMVVRQPGPVSVDVNARKARAELLYNNALELANHGRLQDASAAVRDGDLAAEPLYDTYFAALSAWHHARIRAKQCEKIKDFRTLRDTRKVTTREFLQASTLFDQAHEKALASDDVARAKTIDTHSQRMLDDQFTFISADDNLNPLPDLANKASANVQRSTSLLDADTMHVYNKIFWAGVEAWAKKPSREYNVIHMAKLRIAALQKQNFSPADIGTDMSRMAAIVERRDKNFAGKIRALGGGR